MNVLKAFKTVTLCAAFSAAITTTAAVFDKLASEMGTPVSFMEKANAQEQKKRRTPALSEKMFKSMAKVEELVSPPEESGKKPNLPAALNELAKIERGCEKCNRYELAQVYFRYAWIYATQEKYANSLKYYDKVVAQSPDIPLGLELQSLYYMAQLAMQIDQYKRALGYLNKWMGMSSDVKPEAYDLKARICYQMDNKKCALDNINKTVSMREKEGIAKEHEYNLQRAMYLEKENFKTTAKIMEKLVRHYPKKSYWVQLSAVYGMLNREKAQLGTLETAYLMGGVKKQQGLVNLAYLYINSGVPYRAAVVLEKGMKDKLVKRSEKNLILLANAWQQSKDVKKAIPVLQEAAKSSSNGDLYGQLVGLYLDTDNNKAAVSAAKQAFKKGVKKRNAEVHLNVGIAYMNLENFKSAINSFKEAEKDKTVRKTASAWRKYAEKEFERTKAIESAI